MKRKYCIFLILFGILFTEYASAQMRKYGHLRRKNWELYTTANAYCGNTIFNGDISSSRFFFGKETGDRELGLNEYGRTYGFALQKKFNVFSDIQLRVDHGKVFGIKFLSLLGDTVNQKIESTFSSFSLNYVLNLNRIFDDKKYNSITFHFTSGIGLVFYRTKKKTITTDKFLYNSELNYGYDSLGRSKNVAQLYDFAIQLGFGMQYVFSRNIFLKLDFNTLYLLSDRMDATVSGTASDMFFLPSIGIAYIILDTKKQRRGRMRRFTL